MRLIIVGLVTCGAVLASGCDRSEGTGGARNAGQDSLSVAGAPLEGAPKRTSPELGYVSIAPEISEETPVVQRRLPTAAGHPTFLRNDTLYAAADDLVPVLSPGARVTLSDRVVVVNGRNLPVNGLEQNGAVYVPVKAFAREFRAYTLINEVDGSATIWPREALIYWRKNGPGNAPVLIDAAAEGLIPRE